MIAAFILLACRLTFSKALEDCHLRGTSWYFIFVPRVLRFLEMGTTSSRPECESAIFDTYQL